MTLSPADQSEIRNLVGRYAFAIDFVEAEAWAETFTEDGEFVLPTETLRGREQLVAMAAANKERRPMRHWVSNLVVEGDEDRATSRAYFIVFGVAGQLKPLLTGQYRDDLVRTPAGWRFAKREVLMDGQ